jgi:phospholipid/cholesterol/gamma-HCH transport system permease protein
MIVPYEQDHIPPDLNPFARFRWITLLRIRNMGRAVIMILQAFFFLPQFYRSRRDIRHYMFLIGIRSFGVTSTVALFTGMILALQAGLVLKEYGQEMRVGTLVCQSMCREMGPFMTALILAASVGSAMAAQLGTMAVSEEITALEIMSVNPVRFLVMPRLLAMMIMCPALTVYTTIIGIIGGGLVAKTQLDVPWPLYFEHVFNLDFFGVKEIWVGVLKAFVFSIIVVTISCYQGMATTGGAIGVGIATRKSVVFSFLAILIVGYCITRIFY